jgi:diguanylate cyclase (GGDEF)-like protein
LMFRLGGEEFVVVLPGTGVSTAMAIAEQIRRRVENTLVNGIRVTLSCGVAVGPEGVEGLLAKADERLYLAKESGRNCVIGPDRPQSTERFAPFDSPNQATAG